MVIEFLVGTAILALVGVLILTDAGQVLRIPKWVIVAYFRHHKWIMGLSVALFAAAAILNAKQDVLPLWGIIPIGIGLVGCFLVTKYLVSYVMFQAKQHRAIYKTNVAADCDGYLNPNDTVYVIEHNGVEFP